MKKRFLSIVLALAIVLCLMPGMSIMASAEEAEEKSEMIAFNHDKTAESVQFTLVTQLTGHNFSGEGRDNGDVTHSFKCIGCDEYDTDIKYEHTYRPVEKVSDNPLTYTARCTVCSSETDNYQIPNKSFNYTGPNTYYYSVEKGETIKSGEKLWAISGWGDGELTVYIDGKKVTVVEKGESWIVPQCVKCVDYDTDYSIFGTTKLKMWFESVCEYTLPTCETPETCVYCGFTEDKTLKHTFGSAGGTDSVPPVTSVKPTFPFDDVKPSDWSCDDVVYVYEKGLMNGVSETLFAPQTDTSRAMIVTILWRLEGEPVVNYAMSFGDVAPDQWYTEAIRWAQANGIVNGYNEKTFGINDPITREQMMAILYRYCTYKEYDVSIDENTNFLSYTDFQNASEYAMQAMMWAIDNNILQGSNYVLNPQGSATREQVAAILHRFCKMAVK